MRDKLDILHELHDNACEIEEYRKIKHTDTDGSILTALGNALLKQMRLLIELLSNVIHHPKYK